MATRRHVLLARLALANKARAKKREEALEAEKAKAPPPEREVPSDGQREVARATAKDAMVMGWAVAIQKHAYENRISEHELRKILDEALKHNDKGDGGKIDELEDYRIEKQGRSKLAPRH